MNTIKYKDPTLTINNIKTTENTISGRGGLTLISHYIEKIKFFRLADRKLGKFRLSLKGKAISFIIRQILLFFIDGTHKAISGFDQLKNDEGYASVLEVKKETLLSSHAIKRFFKKFSYFKCEVLRKLINTLFVWRLSVKHPDVIVMDIDTMVMDNDDAKKREGVDVTYKNKKGFQVLQITWNNIIVDAIFRRGNAHSNHGNDVQKALKRVVDLIRTQYSQNVPIVLTLDSGFLDQKNLHYFDKVLGISFICFGKLYDSIKDYVCSVPTGAFYEYSSDHKLWHYTEFGSKLKSWNNVGFLRTIFTTQLCDDNGQMLLNIARPDSVLYTNIGCNEDITRQLESAGHEELTSAEGIIDCAHNRGNNELCNRSLKDFMTSEKLPFKRFGMNAAY
ncbi:MAG: transposase, partial [Thermodesulfobacteriota bacterium]|nr:transposase [Thermodesulfobacteriota bacterium]